MSQEVFCKRAGLPLRRLIYLCEKGAIKPAEDTSGRGSPRRFGEENVTEYRVVELLLGFGFELRRVAAIIGLIRGFFERIRAYSKVPSEFPHSFAEISADKPFWLVMYDHGIVTMQYRVGKKIQNSDYAKILPNGKISGGLRWDENVAKGAISKLEIELSKLAR